MTRALRCAAFALSLFAAPASAQHTHDHAPGPNGGRVEDAGPWHAELVTKAEIVSVYLSDGNGKPLPVEGFKAVAILKSGPKAARVPLAPEGGRLIGRAEGPLGEGPSGAVRITGPDGTNANARFE